jgi:hypothetical protein
MSSRKVVILAEQTMSYAGPYRGRVTNEESTKPCSMIEDETANLTCVGQASSCKDYKSTSSRPLVSRQKKEVMSKCGIFF